MIRIAICDDEAMAARLILSALRDAFDKQSVDCTFEMYTDSRVLAKKLDEGMFYDAILIDIDMPYLDGIRLGTLYQAQLADTLLIYVSGREDLVFDTFQAKPFRFIRKKNFQSELHKILPDALRELKEREKRKLVFPCGSNQAVMLWPERISYVEALGKKQMIHCGTEVHEVNAGFQKVMQQLEGLGFIQTHRSFLVNCRFIRSIDRGELTLDDGSKIPLSRFYLQQVQEEFWKFAAAVKPAT